MEYPFKLSVLIPCYNVERQLELSLWCLEQQWDDDTSMEMVFVNDCSTDGTLMMLQSFCRKHPDNTVLINREHNGGVAQARNEALRVARGQWITFLDPDDALSSGAYQSMCNDYLDENVDILSFGSNIVLGADILPLPHYRGKVVWEGSSKEFYEKFPTNVAWDFIYSHELLDKLGASFPDLSLLEGELFNLDVFLNEGIRVRRLDTKPYYFISRPDGLSGIKPSAHNIKMIDDIMTVMECMEQKKLGQDDEKSAVGIARKQTQISRRLVPIFLRSKQVDKSHIIPIRLQLEQWNVYPYKALVGGVKDTIYHLLFRYPGLLVSLRPLLLKFIGR